MRLIGPAQTPHRARGHAQLAGRVALRQAPIDDPRDDSRAVQFLRAHPYDRRHGRDRTRANRTFLNFGNRTFLYFSYKRIAQNTDRFTRELLTGRLVRLTADVVQLDRYGRALRHPEVDGRDVAEVLVDGGYACVLHIPPNGQGRVEWLRRLEDVARLERRGLWACGLEPC